MTNGYIMYMKDVRKSIVAKHPSFSVTEIAKKVGESWNALTPAQKEKYNELAAKEPKVIKEKKEKIIKAKRPLSGYMKFVKANRAKVAAETKDFKEIGIKLGKMWRSLSVEEQAKYK